MRAHEEAEVILATSLGRLSSRGVPVDNKAILVHELKKYRANLIGISI